MPRSGLEAAPGCCLRLARRKALEFLVSGGRRPWPSEDALGDGAKRRISKGFRLLAEGDGRSPSWGWRDEKAVCAAGLRRRGACVPECEPVAQTAPGWVWEDTGIDSGFEVAVSC